MTLNLLPVFWVQSAGMMVDKFGDFLPLIYLCRLFLNLNNCGIYNKHKHRTLQASG